MFNLSGKIALVTGGNGGIGLGMAKGIAQAGAKIMVAGRNGEKNAQAVAELQDRGAEAASLIVDVTDRDACSGMIAQTADRFGGLDILVANAGINIRKPIVDVSADDWLRVVDTNLNSVFHCCQFAHAELIRRGGGKIVTIGSMLSIFGLPLAVAYAASKGGVVQLTKSLATAWARDNIQVNCVLPGWIDTELTQQGRVDMPELDAKVRGRTPAGRWGVPGDMAGIAAFLASPASDFVTGTAIPVDGGYSVQG